MDKGKWTIIRVIRLSDCEIYPKRVHFELGERIPWFLRCRSKLIPAGCHNESFRSVIPMCTYLICGMVYIKVTSLLKIVEKVVLHHFNNALNPFYLQLYGVGHMVKDHSDREKTLFCHYRGYFSISTKDSFICTIPQTGWYIPRHLLHQSWSTR